MVARTMWLALMAIGVMAVSGLGFAAFTATATANNSATAGTLSVYFGTVSYGGSMYQYSSSAAYTTGCNAGSTSLANSWPASTLSVSSGNFAPGDWCQISAPVINEGSVPATYSVSVTTTATCASWNTACTASTVGSCWEWYSNPDSSATGSLAVGAHETVTTALELNDNSPIAGNGCEGSTGTITLVLSASSITVGENGEPGAL